MTKSYKMVSLSVLIGNHALQKGIPLNDFVQGVHQFSVAIPSCDTMRIWSSMIPNDGIDIFYAGSAQVGAREKNGCKLTTVLFIHLFRFILPYKKRYMRYPWRSFDIVCSDTANGCNPFRCKFEALWQHDRHGHFFLMPDAPHLLPTGSAMVTDQENRRWQIKWSFPKTRAIQLIDNPQQTARTIATCFSRAKIPLLFLIRWMASGSHRTRTASVYPEI